MTLEDLIELIRREQATAQANAAGPVDELTPRMLRDYTRRIVMAFLSKNELPADALGPLVSDTLRSLRAQAETYDAPGFAAPPQARFEGAPGDRDLVRETHSDPRWVVCLEDGQRFRSLRRHLKESHGLTPEQYRTKWGLPPDTPLVAADLSERRSRAALEGGFGKGNRKAKPAGALRKSPGR